MTRSFDFSELALARTLALDLDVVQDLKAASNDVDTDIMIIGARARDLLVTAAVDAGLDESGYIVPGLGDAGDRQFGPRWALPGG